jgi:hypothetical protein
MAGFDTTIISRTCCTESNLLCAAVVIANTQANANVSFRFPIIYLRHRRLSPEYGMRL